jgi:hypothetical protein
MMERPDLIIGATVKFPKRNDRGYNQYKIIDRQDRYLLLECISFACRENLGDLIFCNKQGQRIWIAMFHGRWLECIQDAPNIPATAQQIQ